MNKLEDLSRNPIDYILFALLWPMGHMINLIEDSHGKYTKISYMFVGYVLQKTWFDALYMVYGWMIS